MSEMLRERPDNIQGIQMKRFERNLAFYGLFGAGGGGLGV